jgi:hypothetical protein
MNLHKYYEPTGLLRNMKVRLVTVTRYSKGSVAVATVRFTVFVEFIPLWHTILKMTYVLPPNTANFIIFLNTCYMFPSY